MGPNASVIGNTINDTCFSGQSYAYIQFLDHGVGRSQFPTTLDATHAKFNGALVTNTNLPGRVCG